MRLPNYFLEALRASPGRVQPGPLEPRYGRLTVVAVVSGQKGSGARAVVRCSCGTELTVKATELRAGRRMSCSNAHPCSICEMPVTPHSQRYHMKRYHREPRAA